MVCSENLWASALKASLENPTDEIVPFMEEQCRDLEKATSGIVHARFVEIRHVPKDPTPSEAGMAAVYTKLSQIIGTYDTVEKDVLSQEDIGDTYEKKTYGFDIYSENYKFRPFMVTIGPTYPIELSIDETIWRESRDQFLRYLPIDERDQSDNTIRIEGINELKGCFRTIVESRKLGYILHRLIEDKQPR